MEFSTIKERKMLAFPSMLISAAIEADMSVPDDPDNFAAEDYPHFHVFLRRSTLPTYAESGRTWGKC